jgi:Methyltransferase domain
MLPVISLEADPIGGQCSRFLGGAELAVLIKAIRRVRPVVMVEFGCNDGMTAKRILEDVFSIEQYIGIDVARGHRTTLPQQQDEVPLVPGYHVLGERRFFMHTCDSREVHELPPCDAVFIDGDHSFDAVIRESRIARQWLRRPGIIAWHDYGNPAVEVTAALDHLAAEGWPIAHVESTWLALLMEEAHR